MKVLLTGSLGMLGHALRSSAPADVEIVATDVHDGPLRRLDVTDAAAIAAVLDEERPAVVINAAAYTDVDGCETHWNEALAANGEGPRLLAQACADRGIALLHVSTDYVFDGEIPPPGCYGEDDVTNPLSAYGRSKLAGEEGVRESLGEHWIVRTQWLYGLDGRNFVETMLRLAKERDRLTVVDDQVGSPTSTHALAPVLWEFVLRRPPFGTYHAVNEGSCSWYEFACEIFRQSGLAIEVEPMDSAALDRPAPRPGRSVLKTSKLGSALELQLGDWKEALTDYLARRTPLEAPSS